METPEESKSKSKSKSIMCVVDNNDDKIYVDYYISDEKKFSQVEKKYNEKEKKWDFGENVETVRKSITPFCRTKLGLRASYIVFNSRLYRIGGVKDRKMSSRVDYLDLNKMEKVWVKISNMNHPRVGAYPVVLDGQLYVVGGLSIDYEDETHVFMEVLKMDGSEDKWKWEVIPNPPVAPSSPSSSSSSSSNKCEVKVKHKEEEEVEEKKQEDEICAEKEEEEEEKNISDKLANYFAEIEKEREKNREASWHRTNLRRVYNWAIVGVIKIKDIDVIVAGVDTRYIIRNGPYVLYTYDSKYREWEKYTKIDISRLESLPRKTAVVSGQLMLFVAGCDFTLGGFGYLYVLDFEKERLHVFNLFEKIPDLKFNLYQSCFLVMIEEDKFDVFWEMEGSKSISTVVSSRFILERDSSSMLSSNSSTGTGLIIEVTHQLNRFSLIRNLDCHTLNAVVCLV